MGGWLLSVSTSEWGNHAVTVKFLQIVGWWITRLQVQGSLAWETHGNPAPRSEGSPCRQPKEAEQSLPHSRILTHPCQGESVHQVPNIAGILEK